MHIQADLHCHSIASTHAYSTINELAQSAKEAGIRLFALTDHGPAELMRPTCGIFIITRFFHGKSAAFPCFVAWRRTS